MPNSELGRPKWSHRYPRPRAFIWRAASVAAALAIPTVPALANSGPPIGRVTSVPEPSSEPSSGPRPQPAAPSAPATLALPVQPGNAEATAPDAEASPAKLPSKRRLQYPTVQRPREPIEMTPVPGEVFGGEPAPPRAGLPLRYVPGERIILTEHRDNYFISGVTNGQHMVKFQYSFKFDLWPNASRHSFYFGFTQKSLWDLWNFRGSSPFIESDYAPELFYGYYSKVGDVVPTAGRTTGFLDFARAGIEHESNGLDGPASRGWNRLSAMARAGIYLGSDHYLATAPKVWLPSFGKSDNEDIHDYLGYGSLLVEYGYDPAVKRWYGGGNVTAVGWKGWNTDWDKKGVEVSLQWRPAYEGKFVEWWKFTPYCYMQVFSGFGETLARYNQSATAFRLGISFEDRVNWVTLPKP